MSGQFGWMWNPRAAINATYQGWLKLIGPDYATRLRSITWLLFGATVVMVVGCALAFGAAIVVGVSTDSLNNALLGMLCGASVVVIGYVILRVGISRRMSLVNEYGDRVHTIDPKLSLDECKLLVQRQDFMQKWVVTHPDAFGTDGNERD